MGRNILIFSDGTGQAGGISFDENRTNIYKLYRATRVGPDSFINPAEQIAYYDAGLGSTPPSGGTLGYIVRRLHNFISQATGFGLTANITDCYEVLVRLWQPGDRIYLFGFSRGAYTVRCLGGVLALCGVPTHEEDGRPLKRDGVSARRTAKRAVKRVYQHTSSRKVDQATRRQLQLLSQRKGLAYEFRMNHGSGDGDEKSNAYPYFIGVFDTVAALADKAALVLLFFITAAFGLALSAAIYWIAQLLAPKLLSFVESLELTYMSMLILAGVAYLVTHIKAPRTRKYPLWRTLHLNELRQRFYDTDLNENVPYARHAISIDENRANFDRVRWGSPRQVRPPVPGAPNWFEQFWFAGNHSDIGGGYPENESRLSDIALAWMLDAALSVPDGIKVDRSVLRLHPSSGGLQHDERKRGLGLITRWLGLNWKERRRRIRDNAIVHSSVRERFNLTAVLQHDVTEPYRPTPLREHVDFRDYYPKS